MSYNFYVVEGKKLIDYKPKEEDYIRAWDRNMQKFHSLISANTTFFELKEKYSELLQKVIFLWIKMFAGKRNGIKEETKDFIFATFDGMHVIDTIIGLLTPNEFMKIFPIEKDYNGAKYSCKDYFSCMEYINSLGIDSPIGYENVQKFLWEYWNRDINEYVVVWMKVVSAMSIMQGGKDPFIEFMEEQGVHPRMLHQDGNYMVDDETGERFKITKPKNPIKKLFSVVGTEK